MTDVPHPVEESLSDREKTAMPADLKELFGDLLGEQAHLHARMDQFESGLRTMNGAGVLLAVGVVLLAAAVGLVIRELGADLGVSA